MTVVDMATWASTVFFPSFIFLNAAIDSMQGVPMILTGWTLRVVFHYKLAISVTNCGSTEQSGLHIGCCIGHCVT